MKTQNYDSHVSRAYIIGGAQTDFERNWTKEGKNVIALLKETVNDGLKAAALSYDDIRTLNVQNKIGCFVGNFIAEQYINQGHLGGLLTLVDNSFYGVPSARYEAACASGSVALEAAITKVQNGDYDLALVIGWELMKTVNSRLGGDILGKAAYYEEEGKDIDYPFPKLFGRLADEMVDKYHLDRKRYMDSLAMISVNNYENAKRNPLAQTRKWFMSYEQAKNRGTENNPLVGGCLATSDCSQVTDGAAIVFVASEDFIKSRSLNGKPYIKGYGHRVAPMLFEDKISEAKESEFILPWTRQTVIDAYKRSGLSVDDIDVFETHDCFTSSEYAAISAFGITGPGDEYRAIEEGTIFFNGEKPINPSGGLIGCGHPVGATGVRMCLDIYKQIEGTAEGYQVKKKRINNGMMLNIGGTATTNYVYIIGK